jgi:hypothetical protein
VEWPSQSLWPYPSQLLPLGPSGCVLWKYAMLSTFKRTVTSSSKITPQTIHTVPLKWQKYLQTCTVMNSEHTEHILLTAVSHFNTAYGFRLMGNATKISWTKKNLKDKINEHETKTKTKNTDWCI